MLSDSDFHQLPAPVGGANEPAELETIMSNPYSENRLRPDSVAFLLVDHQAGLVPGIEDHDRMRVKRNVRALARTAAAYDIPVVATTSAPQGPNGPLLTDLVADLPEGTPIIDRQGEVDAFSNDEFKAAVEATGRKTLVIAGVLTEVCLNFASFSARALGYSVHAVIDASGTTSVIGREVTYHRLQEAGVTLNTTAAVLSELLGDWRTPQGPEIAAIFSELAVPFYAESVAVWAANQPQPILA